MKGIVILTNCEFHFITVHENLVQHLCNIISILESTVSKLFQHAIYLSGRKGGNNDIVNLIYNPYFSFDYNMKRAGKTSHYRIPAVIFQRGRGHWAV